MNTPKALCAGLIALAAVALTACVTINIDFPAAAAEKAADRIIDEVWRLEQTPASVREKPVPK